MPRIEISDIQHAIDYYGRFQGLSQEAFGNSEHDSVSAQCARSQLRELIWKLEAAVCREAEALTKISRIPQQADVELALMANNGGGLEFRQDYCTCDETTGNCPCQYCAIDSVLQRVLRLVKPPIVRRRIQTQPSAPEVHSIAGQPIIRVGNYGPQNISFGAGALRSLAAEHPECLTYNDAERTLYYHGTLPVTMTADCPGVQMTFNRALQ